MSHANREVLNTMIAEATVDCHDDSECVTGFHAMLEDHLAVPFHTVVLDVAVTVTEVDLILDLPLPASPPAGNEWIDAYRHWARGR